MVIRKEFKCTTKDIDTVILELAKEIENGWSVESIINDSFELSVALNSYPTFSVTLVKKEYGDMRNFYMNTKML